MEKKVSKGMLAEAQRQGWNIERVGVDSITASCPRAGCALSVLFKAGNAIPATTRPAIEFDQVKVESWDHFRLTMRKQREKLSLSINDVEYCADFATDRLAKCEKNDPAKIPNVLEAIIWAQTLGFELYLRPAALPPITLRMIEDTRPLLTRREKLQNYHRGRRRTDVASDAGS